RIVVMYAGRIVEFGQAEELFLRPKHPYTEALLSAVPTRDPLARKKRIYLSGEVADVTNPPPGCHFHPRCRYAVDLCKTTVPDLREVSHNGASHLVACHRAEELKLTGVPEGGAVVGVLAAAGAAAVIPSLRGIGS